MVNKITLAVFLTVVVCVSSKPAANQPWQYIQRRVRVSPKTKEIPFRDIIPRKTPNYTKGTKIVEGCGVPAFKNTQHRGKNSKIVGGTEVVPHSFPWQAALFINLVRFCGGSLINEEYVLTAGHCLYEMTEVNVILGAHDITQDEITQLTIRSIHLIIHEEYQPNVIHNDVALVRLPIKVTYNDYILPICLPAYSDAYLSVGTIVTITGWGSTTGYHYAPSPTLNSVDVPIYDHTKCNDYYSGIVNEGIICIDSTGDHGTCEGDSGGPMNYAVNGKTVTRGIVSFGPRLGCDSGDPDAFTRVEYFLDWISNNTGIAIDP